jgi:uncharacterized membrane protein YedE/YeeE
MSEPMQRPPLPVIVAVLVVAGLAYAVWALAGPDGNSRALAFSLALGSVFGAVLQRSRFCFFCHTRDLLEKSDPRGTLAILLALAVGAVGYLVIFGAWLPVPAPERLPPTAHIGPVSPVLGLAAYLFGVGMALSGSCISAHLYRLGEGSPTAPFALVGSAVGFALGFMTWNPLYLAAIADAQVVWLPHQFGYAGTIAITLAALAVLALLAVRASRFKVKPGEAGRLDLERVLCALFVQRWPAYVGGIAVGVLSAAAYLRVAPLGVTAELGSLSRTAASDLGLLPSTLYGLDGFRGCVTVVKQALLSSNGLFVGGLVLASLASALVSGEFKPRLPRFDEIWRGLLGGVLMGWGAMVALGCTVGVLLSGIHAGALSGWVFLFFCFAGVAAGLWARRRFAF